MKRKKNRRITCKWDIWEKCGAHRQIYRRVRWGNLILILYSKTIRLSIIIIYRFQNDLSIQWDVRAKEIWDWIENYLIWHYLFYSHSILLYSLSFSLSLSLFVLFRMFHFLSIDFMNEWMNELKNEERKKNIYVKHKNKKKTKYNRNLINWVLKQVEASLFNRHTFVYIFLYFY